MLVDWLLQLVRVKLATMFLTRTGNKARGAYHSALLGFLAE